MNEFFTQEQIGIINEWDSTTWNVEEIKKLELEIINSERSIQQKLFSLKQLDIQLGKYDTIPTVLDLIEYLEHYYPQSWYTEKSIELAKANL